MSKISEILDSNDSIYELALQNLGRANNDIGAKGMTAEQVIQAAIIKQVEGYSYRELAYHLADSGCNNGYDGQGACLRGKNRDGLGMFSGVYFFLRFVTNAS